MSDYGSSRSGGTLRSEDLERRGTAPHAPAGKKRSQEGRPVFGEPYKKKTDLSMKLTMSLGKYDESEINYRDDRNSAGPHSRAAQRHSNSFKKSSKGTSKDSRKPFYNLESKTKSTSSNLVSESKYSSHPKRDKSGSVAKATPTRHPHPGQHPTSLEQGGNHSNHELSSSQRDPSRDTKMAVMSLSCSGVSLDEILGNASSAVSKERPAISGQLKKSRLCDQPPPQSRVPAPLSTRRIPSPKTSLQGRSPSSLTELSQMAPETRPVKGGKVPSRSIHHKHSSQRDSPSRHCPPSPHSPLLEAQQKGKSLSNTRNHSDTLPRKPKASSLNSQDSGNPLTSKKRRLHKEKQCLQGPSKIDLSSTVNPRGDLSSTVNPRGDLSNTVNPRGDLSSTVNPRGDLSSTVNPRGDLSSTVNLRGDHSSTVNPRGDLSNTVNPRGDLSSTVNPRGDHSSTVNPRGDHSSTVNPRGDHSNTVNPRGDLSSTVNPRGDLSSTVNPRGDLSNTVNLRGDHSSTVNPRGDLSSTVNPRGDLSSKGSRRRQSNDSSHHTQIGGKYPKASQAFVVSSSVKTSPSRSRPYQLAISTNKPVEPYEDISMDSGSSSVDQILAKMTSAVPTPHSGIRTPCKVPKSFDFPNPHASAFAIPRASLIHQPQLALKVPFSGGQFVAASSSSPQRGGEDLAREDPAPDEFRHLLTDLNTSTDDNSSSSSRSNSCSPQPSTPPTESPKRFPPATPTLNKVIELINSSTIQPITPLPVTKAVGLFARTELSGEGPFARTELSGEGPFARTELSGEGPFARTANKTPATSVGTASEEEERDSNSESETSSDDAESSEGSSDSEGEMSPTGVGLIEPNSFSSWPPQDVKDTVQPSSSAIDEIRRRLTAHPADDTPRHTTEGSPPKGPHHHDNSNPKDEEGSESGEVSGSDLSDDETTEPVELIVKIDRNRVKIGGSVLVTTNPSQKQQAIVGPYNIQRTKRPSRSNSDEAAPSMRYATSHYNHPDLDDYYRRRHDPSHCPGSPHWHSDTQHRPISSDWGTNRHDPSWDRRRRYPMWHSAQSADMHLSEAKTSKHCGDKAVSDHSKAECYLEAVTSYMMWGHLLEIENKSCLHCYKDVIPLIEYILFKNQNGLNLVIQEEPISVLSLRCLATLYYKIFELESKVEFYSITQKKLKEFFPTKSKDKCNSISPYHFSNSPVAPSPASVASSSSYQDNHGTSGDGATTIPSHIYARVVKQLSFFDNLFKGNEYWKQSNDLIAKGPQNARFFADLDKTRGPLTQFSPIEVVADWVREGLNRIRGGHRRLY